MIMIMRVMFRERVNRPWLTVACHVAMQAPMNEKII